MPGDGVGPPAAAAARAPDVLVYGAATCEDTAITRSRLEALAVPFREIDIDAEGSALARVIALEGRRVTPTVVLGDGGTAFAEPSIETLEERLRDAGATFSPPVATQVRGALADRPIPLRTLPKTSGAAFSLEAARGRTTTALFLAHSADCLACRGYARQLGLQAAAMHDAGGQAVVVVADTLDRSRRWRDDLPSTVVLLADADGAWRGAVRASLPLEADGVALLVLDRFAAPAAISSAGEAGGLIGPAEATEWLRFLALECPECGNDVRWPE